MNQIQNQQQIPGQQQQHSVQQLQQQVRYPSVPPSHQYQHHGYEFRQPQNFQAFNPTISHATLTLPHNAQVQTSTTTNGQTMVDVFNPNLPNVYDQYTQQMMQPQYLPQQYTMPYQPQPIYQQPPPPVQKPLPQREKKILSFLNPDTNTKVDLPKKEQKADASTASSPFEPAKHDTKPHTPVNEVKAEIPPPEAKQVSAEEINSQFSRAIANRAVSGRTISASRPPKEEENEPAVPFTSPNASSATVVDESVGYSAPDSKEATPVFDEQQNGERSPAPEQMATAPSIVLEEPQAETSGVTEEKPETYEAPSQLDRAGLIQHYESKVAEFLEKPEFIADIQNKVYSRPFVQLLREIIRNFHTVPCPISEDKLKKIGIDRTTMPAPANVSHGKGKYSSRGGSGNDFNPSWANNAQQNNIRRQYPGRPSDNKNKKNQGPRPPIANRPSIQRQQPKLKRSENAWTPDTLKGGSNVDLSSDEARIAKVRKDVRGLLNKITPSTYADLSVEMINKCVWRDTVTLPTVVELIFIKAVEEPTFVKIYSDLCAALHKAEQNMEGKDCQRHFHGAIIRKCQTSFESTAVSQYQESITEIEKQIAEEQEKEEKDAKKLAELNEKLEETTAKEKRRMQGTIKFISHLFRIGLLNYKIIENCIVVLIRNAEQSKNELMTEFAVDLMKYVGPYVAVMNLEQNKINDYVTYLDKFKPIVSNRVKFMIIDLMELRDKGWAKKGDGPKTKDEVKMDVMKEEEQNRRERDVYEQTNDPNRKRGNIIDKQRYQSRPSADKKDRLNAAIAASSSTGSSLRKDTSLSKCEQQPTRLGAEKKAWGKPQINTPNAPSPNNKQIPKVISRQSADNRQQTSNDVRKSGMQKETKPAPPQNPKGGSRSVSTTPPPAEPTSSRSQNNSPTFTPEDKFDKTAFKSGFKECLQSYLDGISADDVCKSLIELNSELNNPVLFFEQMLKYSCEHLKLSDEKERHAVSLMVVKCSQNPVLKNAFSEAFKKYCKYLVDNDIEGDVPHLKKTFPELVVDIMTYADKEKTIHTKEFFEGFKEFHKNGNEMFARTFSLFAQVLIARNETNIGVILSMVYEEFAEADPYYKSENMQDILRSEKVDYENHQNLKELLDANS
jgi:hypothetical protein